MPAIAGKQSKNGRAVVAQWTAALSWYGICIVYGQWLDWVFGHSTEQYYEKKLMIKA
jgi:hypothetical protein